jgi:hypothetical protein
MKSPSHYMLPCALLLLGAFAFCGQFDRSGQEKPAAGAPVARAAQPKKQVTRVVAASSKRPPASVTQVGAVMDAMGFLLVGAEVRCGDLRVKTDANGRFGIEMPKRDEATVEIASAGCRGIWTSVNPLARDPLFVALEPRAPWDEADAAASAQPTENVLWGEGMALDRRGQPLGDAMVFVAETGAVGRVDLTGRFRVALPAVGDATLVLHAPAADAQGLAARAEPFTPVRRKGVLPVPDLVGHPAAQLRCTVRGVDGEPLAGVPVVVRAGDVVRSLQTGDGGIVRLGGLPAGNCSVRVFPFRGELGVRSDVALSGSATELDLHLQSADERRMRVVTRGGSPVASAYVATSRDGLRQGVARTDQDGWVRVYGGGRSSDYEVRDGTDLSPLHLVGPPTEADELVVTLP